MRLKFLARKSETSIGKARTSLYTEMISLGNHLVEARHAVTPVAVSPRASLVFLSKQYC
jgi:hypothetical protein